MEVYKREECRGCLYFRNNTHAQTCDYILEVGHSRPYPVETCDIYKEHRKEQRC